MCLALSFSMYFELKSHDDVGIESLGSFTLDEVMEDAMLDLEYMFDHEIMSMLEDYRRMAELKAESNVEASIEPGQAAQKPRMPLPYDPNAIHAPKMQDVQDLTAMYLKESHKSIHVQRMIDVQELAAQGDMEGKTHDFMAANIHNFGNKIDNTLTQSTTFPEKLHSTLDEILLRIIGDSLEERLKVERFAHLELTIRRTVHKNILHSIVKVPKDLLPNVITAKKLTTTGEKFKNDESKEVNDKFPFVLDSDDEDDHPATLALEIPAGNVFVHKDFNVLNRLEVERFAHLELITRRTVHKNVKNKLVPKDLLPDVIIAKNLTTTGEKFTNDESKEVNDKSPFVLDFDDEDDHLATPASEILAPVQGEQESSGSSTDTNPLEMYEKALNKMNITQLAAQKKKLQEIKAYRKWVMERTRNQSSRVVDNLPITGIKYHIEPNKQATMTITRNHQPLNFKVYTGLRSKVLGFIEWVEVHALATKKSGRHITQLMKNLAAKFKWVEETAKKLDISSSSTITKPLVDMTEGNLIPPQARTIQLLKMHKHTKRDLDFPKPVVAQMLSEIEAIHDVDQAREIVEKNLDGCSLPMRETHVNLQSQGNYTLFRETMAIPVQNINHSAFRSMFEKEKLSGNNFNDWFARLKLVLRVEKKMHVIEQPLPPAPQAGAEPNIVAQWTALYDAHTEIACLMLGSMTPELHRQFEVHYPYDMIQELRSMFEKQAGVEKFDLIQSFHACKQEEGKSVADYVLKMKGYVEQLERLGYMLPQDISVGLILNGLTKDFVGFVRNYNNAITWKTIGEIHAMLIEYEKGLPKKAETPQVMMIKSGKIQKANKKSLNAKGKNKGNGKGKDKKVYIPKPNNPKPAAKERPAKDDACHHCKEVGHWKRNCPVYLAELQKKRKQVGSASSSGIFTIELFSFPNNNSWVYDTGCGTNICITKQGFRIERKLKQGALYLYVGNGVRAQVEAIGSFDLVLPNGLVICLDNCHYAPTITRGVVSVSPFG
ncbi:retrotransposon protein, putative, ty1-copia subclass [Tanacetum coccineum]